MQPKIMSLILICAGMLAVIGIIIMLANYYTLNGIKSKQIGDGQHGSARWATKGEIKRTYAHVAYTPDKWRKGVYTKPVGLLKRLWCKLLSRILKREITPKIRIITLPQGTIIGMKKSRKKITAIVDTGDVHTLMTAAAGAGKTACFLYPNLEYACASGMSFFCTDTKGDLYRNYGNVAKEYYGFDTSVIELRNPIQSDKNNLLHLVQKYMQIYLSSNNLSAKSKCEKYAKLLSKTIINSGGGDSSSYGQNAFFMMLPRG